MTLNYVVELYKIIAEVSENNPRGTIKWADIKGSITLLFVREMIEYRVM